MATSIVLRNGLIVSEEEFNEKVNLGALDRFYEESAANQDATLEFTTGAISAAELGAVAKGDDDVNPFEPIGLGKPLSIEILSLYTGMLPGRFGLGKPDLMVTSAVKSIETYAAQPMAVNQITRGPNSHQTVTPAADEAGSPIAYYTKSFVDDSLLCTISILADTFDDKLLGHLSSLLKTAAGLPVCITAIPGGASLAGAVLAGSALVNLAGNMGKSLFERSSHLRDTLKINLETPDHNRVKSETRIIANDIHKNLFTTGYSTKLVDDGLGNQRIMLVNGMGQPYAGDAPYAIVSIDGRERRNLENFAPTLATAALLEQFMGADDPTGKVVGILEEAMGLYNDYSFHQRAGAIKKEISRLKPTSPTFDKDRQKLEAMLEANNRNIRNELFST